MNKNQYVEFRQFSTFELPDQILHSVPIHYPQDMTNKQVSHITDNYKSRWLR